MRIYEEDEGIYGLDDFGMAQSPKYLIRVEVDAAGTARHIVGLIREKYGLIARMTKRPSAKVAPGVVAVKPAPKVGRARIMKKRVTPAMPGRPSLSKKRCVLMRPGTRSEGWYYTGTRTRCIPTEEEKAFAKFVPRQSFWARLFGRR